MGPLEKLLSMASVHPFYDIGLVIYVGSQSRWTMSVSPDPSDTVVVPLPSQNQYNDASNKLVAVSPESVEVLREAYKEDAH
ncbi:hypothetical protein B0H19DRAFT_1264482 [Mycena capillaripes]|nr:hypothetical protein B0H19DRAFT_1264482 [Mycena capillaripes]